MNTIFDLFQFGMKPEIIYKGLFKLIITYIIPLLIIVNVPAKVLINKISIPEIWVSLLIGILLYIISGVFWKKALRKYSSASS